MKKKQIDKRLRRALAVFCLFLTVASGGAFYYFYGRSPEVERTVPAYSYQHRGELTYLVRVKPNSIYPENVLGPGRVYFAKLVDQIGVKLFYRFDGDQAASLKAAYDVVATVEAPQMWQKEFVLVPFTEITAEGNSISFQKEFSVNFSYFLDVLKRTNDEVGVSAREPKLNIKANVYLKAVGREGTVKETLTPVMSIPLTTGEFKIGGEPLVQKNGALTKTETYADPEMAARLQILTYGSAAAGCAAFLALVVLLWLTGGRPVDEKKEEYARMRRKYGDRLVEVGKEIKLPLGAAVIPLGSLEALVKAADELSKPVLLAEPDDPGMPPVFYVIDGLTVYRHEFAFGGRAAGVKAKKRRLPEGAPAAPAEQMGAPLD